ncbi:uncharacterized protein LACBIDRAFT_301715 [Laccaria bicolor S238N-H82]|uniref:Predicted protein n=1 Tax=Laccaria bicolor (strain S238N-H82 / ATCC MYA-4686) TaxID=486041 RepID=B0CP41_LACBS|nr:uncharacterized protein LACBIDRAFT_301715 [Laccaria bicolor S238N-H82]EDR16041.1 predicted protein [Laccaria bicolor S238N-H82]|eukprot:XP_001874249.1 predicted protein [Laccaria bicolor S238N-H82]
MSVVNPVKPSLVELTLSMPVRSLKMLLPLCKIWWNPSPITSLGLTLMISIELSSLKTSRPLFYKMTLNCLCLEICLSVQEMTSCEITSSAALEFTSWVETLSRIFLMMLRV